MPAVDGRSAGRRSSSALRAVGRAGAGRVALIGFVVISAGLYATFPLNDVFAGLAVAALVAVLWSAGRSLRRRSANAGWGLVYAGVTLAASGIVPFSLRVMLGWPVPVELGHVLLFLSYSTLAVGLIRLAYGAGDDRRIDIDALIDVAVVGVLASALVWQFVGRYVLAEARLDPSMLAATLGHSIFAVVLLSLTTRVLIERSSAPDAYLLAGGVACVLVANLAYLAHVDAEDAGSWAATTWLVGLLLLGLAVAARTHLRRTAAATAAAAPLPFGRVALSLAPVPLPVALGLIDGLRSQALDRWVVALATLLLTTLALLRAGRLLSDARTAWTQLAARERLFQVLATNSSDAVLRVDRDGKARAEVLVLPALTRAGQTVDGERTDIAIDVTALTGDAYHGLLARAISRPGTPTFAELPVRDRFGDQLWVGARAVDLIHDPAVGAIVINLHDITQRKAAEEELTHQALHDSLTGLPNRALFRDRLEHALSRRSRVDGETAVLYLDLDGFKGVNDGLGHEVGDRLLRQVADRLVAIVRAGETVARLGGDEFAILVEASEQAREDAIAAAERIIESLRTPFDLDGRLVSVSVSVGIAVSEPETTSAGLLRNADVAMYEAKASGRGRWVAYEPSFDRDTDEQLQLESDLAGALAREEFLLHYQPVIRLDSDRIVGFEALLRWQHPNRGLISPDRFIPVLERSGAIVDVGAWVLRTACGQLAEWHRRLGPDLTMSVNLSGRQLERADFSATVADVLSEAGIRPRELMLEVTETVLVDNERAADQLRQLHALGIRLAIDDFGTGYSSLAYLRNFPIDTIKVDRSFVAAIEDANLLPALVKGMLDLGRTLEMSTIAEGIELANQRDLLRADGCLLGQGFLFSRPLPAGEAERYLSEHLATRAASTPAPATA